MCKTLSVPYNEVRVYSIDLKHEDIKVMDEIKLKLKQFYEIDPKFYILNSSSQQYKEFLEFYEKNK